MKIKAFLLVYFFTAISSTLFAQNDSSFLNRAARSLYDDYDNHPVEKVYLQLDRDGYEPGDTIWFKAYLVAGKDHRLSAISGVLYAELIDPKDSLRKRLILPLSMGLTNGDFILPVDLAPGRCHIRAYTNWMRNDDAGYFYDENIIIGNRYNMPVEAKLLPAAKSLTIPGKGVPVAPKIDVQFFPEGGDLVHGLRSKVAVKVVSAAGFGENISGVIVDNDNRETAYFSTQHLGMGTFALTPQPGKTYKAKIRAGDSSIFTVDLPAAKDEGFTLSANAIEGDSLHIKIAANDKLFKKLQNIRFYLMAQQNGNICYTADAKLESPVFTASIPKTRFKTGILQITLFSASGEALNERLVFIQNHDQLKLALTADSIAQPWHQFNLNLNANSHDKQPAAGSFSVAVTDESIAGNDVRPEATIFTHLLLTSDLKGYIEDPNYYFTNVNDKTRADLDLLMLTQGYRKLVWKQVLDSVRTPVVYAAEKGLDMEGKVMTPSGGPVVNGRVSITSIKDMLMIDTLTAADGSFRFTNLEFPDTAKVIVKARKANNSKNVAIYIKQHDYPTINKRLNISGEYLSNPVFNSQPGNAKLESALPADTGIKKHTLNQVNINAHKVHPPDRYNGYGSVYEYDVNLAQLKEYAELKEAIAHKIPGILLDSHGKLRYDGQVLMVMINGLQRGADDLNIYGINDIEGIRVIDATLTTGPLLMVTTHPFTARDSIHIKLKEVKIKANKIDKPDKSNQYGTDAPYVISPERIKNLGPNLNPGLASLIPGATYEDGGLIRSVGHHPVLLHIVLNDHEIVQTGDSENDNRVIGKPKGVDFHPDNINNYVGTEDIESIKILKGQYYKNLYGIHFYPGNFDNDDIVLITTKQYAGTAKSPNATLKQANIKKGNDDKYVTTELPTGLMIYPFKGYYKAREFYSPKFTAPQNSHSYDPRATIYWNPNVVTDKNGHATFSYFNAGNKGSYRIVIEGIDVNGNLGRLEYRYFVRD